MLEDRISELRDRKANILDHNHFIKSAIFLPLVKHNNELFVLFEKRSADLKQQPGEICFPGGRVESGENPLEASVRETCEELGVMPEDIEIIAPLDIMVSPFNAIIYPYLGYIKDLSNLNLNPDEVEELFYVPLSFLLSYEPVCATISLKVSFPDNYPFELVPNGRNYPYRDGKYTQHFYIWKDRIIWGLTARILNHFMDFIQTS